MGVAKVTVIVYLVEFQRPIPGWINRHYAGATHDLDERVAAHRAGGTSKMFAIARDWSIDFTVVRMWEFEDDDEGWDAERWLKEQKDLPGFCPNCSENPRGFSSGRHKGARERYEPLLKKERLQREYYRMLRFDEGLEHEAARDISRGKVRA